MTATFHQPELTDGIVWHAKTGPWAWVRVESVHYDALSDLDRIGALEAFRAVLAAIGSGEGHLLVVNQPARPTPAAGTPQWRAYSAGVAAWERDAAYTERVTYLGARLNSRRVGELTRLATMVARRIGASRDQGGATERNDYVDQADGLARYMRGSGWLVTPATVDELKRLTARRMWLDLDPAALSTEHVDVYKVGAPGIGGVAGPAAMYHTSDGGPEQMSTSTGNEPVDRYSCSLVAVSPFELAAFPGGEWLAPFPDLDPMPELSIRFEIVRAAEQAREFDRSRMALTDQIANIGRADKVGLSLREQHEAAEQLAHAVRQARVPWVRPSLTVSVTGGTLRELRQRVDAIVPAFESRGVHLIRPNADQPALLAEQSPGEPWVCRKWRRRQPATALAAGMPHAVAAIGDKAGPYRGHTTKNLGRWPVRHDVLAMAASNVSPVVAVTGKPGAGKSALTKTVGYESALRGARILWLDPPGETDPIVALMEAAGITVRVISLDHRFAGSLDPWAVWPAGLNGEANEAAILATDLVKIVLGGSMPLEMETAIAAAADATGRLSAPGMRTFVDAIGGQIADALRSYFRGNLGQLIYGTGGADLDLAAQVTVIRYVGLDLPPLGVDPSTVAQRLSLAVLHGSAALMARLMTNGGPGRKLTILDEAHQLTRSSAGRGQVLRSALMGRKMDMALWLSTQNGEHLGDDATLSTVSTVFAHRCEGTEAEGIARLLLREGNPDVVGQLPGLGDGECFMRDRWGRVARVQLDIADALVWEAVQTTPPGEEPTSVPTSAL